MANQTDSYNAESKFSGVRVLPENLVIVGIDCKDDQRPELADPDRVHLKLDPEMTKSIALHGVRVPVVIRKFRGDENVYVVAGRRRVLHAREANKLHAGDQPILVPCVPDDNPDPSVSFTLENEFRVDNSVLAKARHAARMKARGATDDYICGLYAITRQALSKWWLLLEAPPLVQQAVERKEITASVAAEIAKVEPSKQPEALQAAIDAGKGSAAKDAVQRLTKPRAEDDERPRRIGVATLKKWEAAIAAAIEEMPEPEMQNVSGIEASVARDVLRAILGEGSRALKEYPTVQKALKDAIKGEQS